MQKLDLWCGNTATIEELFGQSDQLRYSAPDPLHDQTKNSCNESLEVYKYTSHSCNHSEFF